MKANFATGNLADRGGELLSSATKSAVAITLLSCLIAGAFTAATSAADAARSERVDAQSVNRANKGDRLPAPSKFTSATTPLVTSMQRPPVGCDPAFSRAADPGRAHIFGRCVS
jgi:hypothetical protein